jgi:signal transduction histidine kinase
MLEEVLKVLIVEDAPAYATLLMHLLQSSDINTEIADDLESGLQLAIAGEPDVILLDLGLPDCQGLNTFSVFRDRCPDIPIVIISGLDDEIIAAQAVKEGAQDYLVKGTYLTQGEAGKMLLLHSIRYAIERHQTQMELREERNLLEIRVAERTKELQEVNRKLRWYYDRLHILREIDHAALEAKSPEQVASIALSQFSRLVQYSYADILLFVQDQGKTHNQMNPPRNRVVAIARRTHDQPLKTGELFDTSDFMVNHRLRRGKHYVVDNLDDLINLSPFEKRLHQHGVRSYLMVPLIAEAELIGIINLGQNQPNAFSEDSIYSAQQIAIPLALMLRNAQLFEHLRAARSHLQELTKNLVSTQEEERQRLSLELHDDAGQAMTALKIKLTMIHKNLSPRCQHLQAPLEDTISLVSDAMERIRSLAYDLHPPALDAVGLNQALEDYCQRISRQTGMHIDYTATDLQNLPGHYEISIYRIVQEALNNAIKHAKANYATVKLSIKDNEIILKVTDNGIGFEPHQLMSRDPNKGLGLQSISERIEALGGTFDLYSQPGQGTTLLIRVPWRQPV